MLQMTAAGNLLGAHCRRTEGITSWTCCFVLLWLCTISYYNKACIILFRDLNTESLTFKILLIIPESTMFSVDAGLFKMEWIISKLKFD